MKNHTDNNTTLENSMHKPAVADVINNCAYVLSFLDTAFTLSNREQITLSYDAQSGLSLILSDISQRLFETADVLSNNQTDMEV